MKSNIEMKMELMERRQCVILWESFIMSRGKEVKELREKMGMNRREFSDYYGIPYRTVQDWETEKRELPDYLLRLLNYRAEIECRIERVDK